MRMALGAQNHFPQHRWGTKGCAACEAVLALDLA